MMEGKTAPVVPERESNMELLRITSIFMIIIFHCACKSGFDFASGFSVNKLAVKCFGCWANWGSICLR